MINTLFGIFFLLPNMDATSASLYFFIVSMNSLIYEKLYTDRAMTSGIEIRSHQSRAIIPILALHDVRAYIASNDDEEGMS